MKRKEVNNITDVDQLKKVINEKGVKTTWLCESAPISYYNFRRSMQKTRAFTVVEAYGISKALGLNARERDEIFFADQVQ